MTFCIVLLLTTALLALSGIGIDYYFNIRRKAMVKKFRAYKKIKLVINSCRTQSQLHGAQRMLDSYSLIYGGDVYWWTMHNLYYDRVFRETLPQSEDWDINQIKNKQN